MALVIKDRVKETTTTTGTGTLTLAGAAGGFQAFSAIGDGNTTYYAITDQATGDWEVGIGTYTASGTTLSRDTILASSNAGSAVNLSAGIKNAFATYPAGKAAFFDDIPTNNNQLTNGAGYITGNQTITLSGDVSGSGTTSISVTVADDSHTHDTRYYTETEIGNFFSGSTAITGYSKTNWDTAYTWGNHASAGYLTGNQTITLSGDATGSGTTAITVTVADDSHNHIISNVDGLQTALDGKQSLDADLTAIAGLSSADGNFIVGSATGWVAESGATARTSLGLGALATLSTVDAATITDNSVGAAELNVTGNGTTSQYLRSDGDGTFTWATPTDTNTTYSAGTGLTLSTTTFSVNYGTAAGTACQGNDSRLSNSRKCNNTFDSAATARTNLGLGSLATLSTVNAATITDNSVGAAELNVSGNGTTSQYLRSDGDGTFTWATPTNTTYSADGNYGLTLSGTTFRLEDDRRRNSSTVDIYSGNTHDYTFYDASHGIRWYTAGAEDMRLQDNGTLHVDGDVVAYSTTISDERLKENIVGIDGALDKVSHLNGYTFTYKADGKISAGVIAQEVEKVLPEAVSEMELPLKADDGQEYKVVNYDALHGLLIEAVKELTDRVKELEAKA